VQALTRVRANKRVMEVAQDARIIELEQANAKLMAELEQARLALVKAEAHRNSLCVRLEEECADCCQYAQVGKN
jgi:hypothetical protein